MNNSSKNFQFKYIDVHAHVNFPDYDNDREEVIARALENGTAMINVGTSLETSKKIVELAEKYDEGVYAIVGMHPTEVGPDNRFDVAEFEKLMKSPKVVGIGECGIDVFKLEQYRPELDKNVVLKMQAEDFRKQIELALKYDKPIMIHARESYGQILEIIDEYFNMPGVRLRGNAHFFAGSIEEAQAFLDRGFTISFTGVITFAKQYEELVKFAPLESILSETDCPFVTPVPFRGQRNEPFYVKEVVSCIAKIKGLEAEIVSQSLVENAKRLFALG